MGVSMERLRKQLGRVEVPDHAESTQQFADRHGIPYSQARQLLSDGVKAGILDRGRKVVCNAEGVMRPTMMYWEKPAPKGKK